jgi:hypothetical protein
MPQENLVVALHFLFLWGTVIAGLEAGLLLPFSKLIAIPLGAALWAIGLFYNFHLIQTRRAQSPHVRSLPPRSNERIAARTLMNLGIALGFRSWLTIITAFLLIPLHLWSARRTMEYLGFIGRRNVGLVSRERMRRH